MSEEALRYPIGPFDLDRPVTAEDLAGAIAGLAALPDRLRDSVRGLSDEQLDTPYRPGGWCPRQIVHHLADSHLNGYARIKLALTEETPTVKPYLEALWAELADSRLPVAASLGILDGVHARWVALLRGLGPAELARTFRHPERGRLVRLDTQAAHYDWHGRHHTAHILGLRQRMGWR
jgi:hypothetical protein